METNNKTKEEVTMIDTDALAKTLNTKEKRVPSIGVQPVNVQVMAERLAMEDLREESEGKCDTVDPDSIEGQQYARLLFNSIELYKEIILIHRIDG